MVCLHRLCRAPAQPPAALPLAHSPQDGACAVCLGMVRARAAAAAAVLDTARRVRTPPPARPRHTAPYRDWCADRPSWRTHFSAAARMGRTSVVRAKWPRWFTPSWYSKPSLVVMSGQYMTPAGRQCMQHAMCMQQRMRLGGLGSVRCGGPSISEPTGPGKWQTHAGLANTAA
jgi:hypothetical protein